MPATRALAPPPDARPGGEPTEGELAVLRLMAQGYSNAGIAGRLFLSRKTVECHVSRLFDKLDLVPADRDRNRRVLAVIWWLERSRAIPRAVPVVEVQRRLHDPPLDPVQRSG